MGRCLILNPTGETRLKYPSKEKKGQTNKPSKKDGQVNKNERGA
jgi:hypothetical protein